MSHTVVSTGVLAERCRDAHVEVEATWGIFQYMIAAYREPDQEIGKQMMKALIDAVSTGVPTALVEIRKLGRTLTRCAADILAFFDRSGTSNGPTEAINGRLAHSAAPPSASAA